VDFQGTLFDTAGAEVGPLAALTRHPLSRGAWVDVRRNWITGADDVFDALVADVPWRAERRQMYDRVVDVPRLVHTYAVGEELPHPLLADARTTLNVHYLPELGEPFVSAGCCYYRTGHDSVAWHGDTIGRGRTDDTMVAIVSFGDPRKLLLRPRGGGESLCVGLLYTTPSPRDISGSRMPA
jgi:alkylated DNA repair dioxygenase AlkB